MRVWPKHWQADVWVCSIKDHVAPAEFANTLRPEDHLLGVRLEDGRRFARCLRCDGWIMHAEPTGNRIRYEHIPALDQIEKPRRDRALSDAIFMRLIALNKGSHALVFTILALALGFLRTRLGALQSVANRVLALLSGPLGDTGQESSRAWIARRLGSILNLKGDKIMLLLALATLYAVVEWTEAIGLWLEKHWAEYLTVLATAGFLPLEIHELINRVSALRVVALVINIALIVWLIWTKRLFGVRGGPHAIHADTDWEEVLTTLPDRQRTKRD